MEKRSLNRPVEELALDVDAGEDKGSGLALRFRDGMTCPECGSSKILHTGSCATCLNCGASLGCS
jgi:hypothetical protein